MKSLLKKLTPARVSACVAGGIMLMAFCHPTVTQAKPIFSISPDRSSIELSQNSSTTDTFTVTNVSGADMPNLVLQASFRSTPFTRESITGGTCRNGGSLANGASCSFIESIQSGSAVGNNRIFPRVCAFGGAQACSTVASGLPVTVSNSGLGRLEFRQNGVAITTLDLNPSESGTVKLFNTGETPVHNSPSIITIANALKPGFTTDCGSILAAGASCTITYNMPTSTDGAPHLITATASNADNSPQELRVTVDRLGRLVFRQGGVDVTQIELKPNDDSSVELVNTGGTAVTTASTSLVSLNPDLTGFTNNCGNTLGSGASCSIAYKNPGPDDGVDRIIQAAGNNADNSPADLSVSISMKGHFAFKKDGGFITNLDVTTSESGTVQLVNTGNTTITSLNLNIGDLPSGFTENCGAALSPGASCNLSYSNPGTTGGVQKVAVATGDVASVDNTPENLTVSVSTPLAGSITTLFGANNRFAGNMFNVENVAPGSPSITINSFDVNIDNAGSPNTICVYYRMGTVVGNESSSSGWSLLGCDSSVTSNGLNVPTPVNVGGLVLLPEQLYGLYVDVDTYRNPGTSMEYTNGGPTLFTNSEIEITTYYGKGTPEFTGRTFFPRQWNGTIYYSET